MARPFTALAVVVPPNKAVPVLRAAVTTVLLSLVAGLPNASSNLTIVAGEKVTPAVAVLGGCV